MNALFPYAVACAGTYEGVPAQIADEARDTHVYLSRIDGVKTLAFEGTSDLQGWYQDFLALPIKVHSHPELGPLHYGIASCVLAIFDQLRAAIGDDEYDLEGHSKGGGECQLAGALMTLAGKPPRRIRAFEPPMVGGAQFRDVLAPVDLVITQTRNREGGDWVPSQPPPDWAGFQWMHARAPLTLIVPDTLTLVQKHRIGAVLSAVAALPERAAA